MGQNSGKQVNVNGHEVLLKGILAETGCSYVWQVVEVNNVQQNYVLKVTKWNSNDEKMIERNKFNLLLIKSLPLSLNLLHFFGSEIVMESESCTFFQLYDYCPGGNLRDYLSRVALTSDIVIALLKDICYGLSALHGNSAPICHNNIHIENILVTGANSFKLGDYDTLTYANKLMANTEQCEFEMSVLNRLVRKEIRAPETFQYKPGNKTTSKSDIWSLGVLLYTLLFNSNPFTDETGHLRKKVILKGEYTIPKNNYDPFLITLLQSMIVVDPAKRPTIQSIITKCVKQYGWKNEEIKATGQTKGQRSGTESDTNNLTSGKTIEKSYANQITERVQAKFYQLVNGENNKRAWIMRCTSYHPGAPKFKYLRYLIIETNESKNIDFLYPMIKERNTNHPIVAIKCMIVILRILQQGPREILEQSTQYIDVPREIGEKWNHNIYEQTNNPFHIEYCRLIHQLSLLIVNKLEFVHNYPMYDSKYLCESGKNELGLEETVDILSRLFIIATIIDSGQSIAFLDHPPFQANLSPLIDEQQNLYGCLTTTLSNLISIAPEDDEMVASLIENYNAMFENMKTFFDRARKHPIATIKDIPVLPLESPLKNADTAKVAVHDALESINRAVIQPQVIVDDNQLEDNDELEDDVTLGDLYRQGPEGIVPLFDPKDFNTNGLSITEYLTKLSKTKDNAICAECKSKPVRYAAFNLGEFLCSTCGKIHKTLGSHISFVRLLSSQNLKKLWLEPLLIIGNKKARLFWESKLDEKDRPAPNDKKNLKLFIKRKYLKRAFVDPKVVKKQEEEEPVDTSPVIRNSIPDISSDTRTSEGDIDLFANVNFNFNNSTPNPSTFAQLQQQQMMRNMNNQMIPPQNQMQFNQFNQMGYQYQNYGRPVSVPYNNYQQMAYYNSQQFLEMNRARLLQQQPMVSSSLPQSPMTNSPTAVPSAKSQTQRSQSQQPPPAPQASSPAQQLSPHPQPTTPQGQQATSATPPISKHRRQTSLVEKPSREEEDETNRSLDLLSMGSTNDSQDIHENPFLSNGDGATVEDEERISSSDSENEEWTELPPTPVMQIEIPDEEERARLALGKVLEDFKVSNIAIAYNDIVMGKRIGIGGFATVYKAIYRNEAVAVKRLQMTKMNDKAIKDFHSEVNLMHRLSHPNIVVFKGLVFDPVCLITEFCENGNLFDLLHLRNSDNREEYFVQLPWQLRLKLARDISRGMNFLHTQPTPIIHRDLKSLNILVNSRWTAKISDFGLSRFKAGDSSQALMTSQCGTFQWMAPEVIGGQLYSEKADIYSFGINLWEIYTRKTPYAGLEPLQVAMVVHTHRRRPTIPADCPQWYAKLISDCWAHDPNKRPSFKEIILRLKEGGPEPKWTEDDLKSV